MNYLFSVDPGLMGTGWAFWEETVGEPLAVGVINSCSTLNNASWIDRGLDITIQLNSAIFNCITKHRFGDTKTDPRFDTEKRTITVLSEYPQFQGSAKGYAATTKGDIYKLATLVGMFGARTIETPFRFEIVEVSVWKGQLPKDIVEKRIRRILGEDACTRLGIKTHAWDAVGIGLWKRGQSWTS